MKNKFAFALFAIILASAFASATVYCTPGVECRTTNECGQFDACSCRAGFDSNGICATCDTIPKRPTANLACTYGGAVYPSTWTPAEGETVRITIMPQGAECCSDPYFTGCKNYGGYYRPVVVENKMGTVVAANFFWENYKASDCIGLKVPFGSFDFTASPGEAPYTIKELSSQYAYHSDLAHGGFYDIENYDGYPENSTPSCLANRKDHCGLKYWETVGVITPAKCAGFDSCFGSDPYLKWKKFDVSACSFSEFSCDYGCGSTITKNEQDGRYFPPACNDFLGCNYGAPSCKLGYCNAKCEKDSDCGQSTCSEGSQVLNITGICTGNCTCANGGVYTCQSLADLCKQTSCNGQRFYCTSKGGKYGWSASPDCSDNNECTIGDTCSLTSTLPGKGACTGKPRVCADSCGQNRLEIGGACTAGQCFADRTFTCDSILDSCKQASCGGSQYYCTDIGNPGNFSWKNTPLCAQADKCILNATCTGGTGYDSGNCKAQNDSKGIAASNYSCKDECFAKGGQLLKSGMSCDGLGGCAPSKTSLCDGSLTSSGQCASASCGNSTYYCAQRNGTWGWSLSAGIGGDTCTANWINTSNVCSALGAVESKSSMGCSNSSDTCKTAACNGQQFYCTNANSENKSSWQWALLPENKSASCDDGNACTYSDTCALGGAQPGTAGKCSGTSYSCKDKCGPDAISTNRQCTGQAPPFECKDSGEAIACTSSKHDLCRDEKCGSPLADYYCTNYAGNWSWTLSKSCFDGNLCTSNDQCTNDGTGSFACVGTAVPSGNLCVDESGRTVQTESQSLSNPGICCYTGTKPTSSSCDTNGGGGLLADSRCVRFTCIGEGKTGYAPFGADTICGKVECPQGTVGTGCDQYCTTDGRCTQCTPSCVLSSSDDIVMECPSKNSNVRITLKVMSYSQGTPSCSIDPELTVMFGAQSDQLSRTNCTNGENYFDINAQQAGYYRIRASGQGLVRECSFESVPLLGAKAPTVFDPVYIAVIFILGLPVGFILVLMFMKATD